MKTDYLKLKIIAFISLTLYCIAFCGFVDSVWLKLILSVLGSVCLPLFAFLTEIAYSNTANLTKLMLRSLVIALLSAYPYRLAFAGETNITKIQSFFSCALTGFCCIGAILFYDKMKTKPQRIFCVAFICSVSWLIGMEFAPYAFILTYIIHILRNDKFFKTAYYISSFLIVISAVSLYFLLCTKYSSYNQDELIRNIGMIGGILALPLIKSYDGTKGYESKAVKWIFDLYYLILLGVIVFIKVM